MSALKTYPSLVPIPQRKSGRAVFDDAGRGTWEWQTSTGVFERFITDEQLHKLEVPHLAIEEDPRAQAKTFEWTGSHMAYAAGGRSRRDGVGTVARLFRRIVGRR